MVTAFTRDVMAFLTLEKHALHMKLCVSLSSGLKGERKSTRLKDGYNWIGDDAD